MDLKHILNHNNNDLLLCKRQRVDESSEPQPLISTEQLFWTSVAEPPDFDYRVIIHWNMKTKDSVLEDHKMPFKKRCAWIDFHDTIEIEWQLNMEHWNGYRASGELPEKLRIRGRKNFG